MKTFSFMCAAIVLASGMVATASAADHVSKSTLTSMGFANAQVLSDTEGAAVRGKFAWASVSGWSWARFPGQATSNKFDSLSIHRSNALAIGGSISVAGGAGPWGFTVVGAAGGAFAYAR